MALVRKESLFLPAMPSREIKFPYLEIKYKYDLLYFTILPIIQNCMSDFPNRKDYLTFIGPGTCLDRFGVLK